MKEIVFLTIEDPSGFVIYDELCIPFFNEIGINVHQIPWTKNEDWSKFDLVIIRSTWDYQKKWKSFIKVLEDIQLKTLLANSLDAVLWNVNKKYLKELEDNGFRIVKSMFYDEPIGKDWYPKNLGDKLVLKPQISANADNTFILNDYEDYTRYISQFVNCPYILQPYLGSIEKIGELSMFYFNGRYSHAVQKVPKLGDFRVQEEHGGKIYSIEPSENALNMGNSIISFLNNKFKQLLFTRIDLVKFQEKWAIMEIELIEPSMYFPYHQDACRNFVNATLEWYENMQIKIKKIDK